MFIFKKDYEYKVCEEDNFVSRIYTVKSGHSYPCYMKNGYWYIGDSDKYNIMLIFSYEDCMKYIKGFGD